MKKKYEIRVRNWWVNNPDWPDGLEPCATPWKKARLFAKCNTEKEAIAICREYNTTHNPGRLSRKAEYEEI
tara:strand:- start:367 stop:579 length:213 start_codon:yes stop_codon:yes gene_type:complete